MSRRDCGVPSDTHRINDAVHFFKSVVVEQSAERGSDANSIASVSRETDGACLTDTESCSLGQSESKEWVRRLRSSLACQHNGRKGSSRSELNAHLRLLDLQLDASSQP